MIAVYSLKSAKFDIITLIKKIIKDEIFRSSKNMSARWVEVSGFLH
jgi:hypothetical protein